MHDRDERALNDEALEQDIRRALLASPSPDFVPRLLKRVATEPRPASRPSWKVVGIALVTFAAAAVLTGVLESTRRTASPVPKRMPTPARTLTGFASADKGQAATPPALASDTASTTSARTTAPPMVAPVRVGRDVRVPRKVVDVKPLYPDTARAAKVEGTVVVEIVIAADGSVSQARLVNSIPLLDRAALDAVRRWKFAPTQLNGRPVEVVMNVVINFTLN